MSPSTQRFRLGALAAATGMALAACGGDSSDNNPRVSGPSIPGGSLVRIATLPKGAEATGLFLKEDGELFLNVQHPSGSNATADADGNVYAYASVGVIQGFNVNGPFQPLSLPGTNAEKEIVRVAAGKYNVLGQEGDTWAGAPDSGLGGIESEDGSVFMFQSNDPDFNGWIPVGTDNDEGYLFTNWENRPGGMSRLNLIRNSNDEWVVNGNEAMMVDFSSVEGTWVNCFGSVTPWGTPLSAEELYFDDTADWNAPGTGIVEDLADYLANEIGTDYTVTYPNPYRYGYNVEITNPTGTPTPEKRFAMGRFSHENAVVMPDEKTAYQSDDGTGTIFYKFVADTAGDLSSGTLYAAKATQDTGTDPSTVGFDITWIELANASDNQIETWIANYDGIDQSDYTGGSNSYITDEEICHWAESKAGSDLACDADATADSNPFGDDRVAFVETRKAARYLGATAEFRKMEGVMTNMKRAGEAVEGMDLVPGESVTTAYAYMAMSNVNATMTDGTGDIQLTTSDGDCGGIYRMPLEAGYNITRMEPAIMGGPFNGGAPDNTCDADNISEPDNLLVMDDGRVIIGEDTGEHENNMVWIFNPDA